MLDKHTVLLCGTLKVYLHQLACLDILPIVVLCSLCTYPVVHNHLDVFKAELLCLYDIGILDMCGASKWASPAFITTKRDSIAC